MNARSLLVAAVAFLCACAPAVKKVSREATESSPALPAHAVEVAYGLWSCERGYVMRKNRCVSEEEISREPGYDVYDPQPAPPAVDLEEPPRRRPGVPTAMPTFEWREADFTPRPITAHAFADDPRNPSTVIGEATRYRLPRGQTLYEAARHLGLGINQVAEAFPDLDLVSPQAGKSFDFPTWWVLPDVEPRGLVINVPELRIYYFSSANPGAVITYPVGLGRDDWQTPIGRFKVIGKSVDPPWLIPESIRAEHVRERGDSRTMIPGGDPENPLGHYRLRLDLPLYGIHGTNIPWGIGMEITHGCVRLYPEDIEQLFEMVPIDTPGQFVYQPVKVGARGGEIYIEVHPDVYSSRFNYVEEAMRLLSAKGWSSYVDWQLLSEALEEKRGTPTRISDGSAPLRRPPVEAHGERPLPPPSS